MANTDSACIYLVRQFYVVCVPLLQIAFWTLGYILSHPDIHRTVLESISSVFGTAGTKLIYIIKDAWSMYGLIGNVCHVLIRDSGWGHGSVGKMPLHKREDLYLFILQHPLKKGGLRIVTHTGNPSA